MGYLKRRPNLLVGICVILLLICVWQGWRLHKYQNSWETAWEAAVKNLGTAARNCGGVFLAESSEQTPSLNGLRTSLRELEACCGQADSLTWPGEAGYGAEYHRLGALGHISAPLSRMEEPLTQEDRELLANWGECITAFGDRLLEPETEPQPSDIRRDILRAEATEKAVYNQAIREFQRALQELNR